jgi:hypothetical protein
MKNKQFPTVRFPRGTRLPSKGQFRFRLLLFWVYTIVWLGMLTAVNFIWEASFYAKAVPLLLLVVGTPYASDLFTTYSQHKSLYDTDVEAPKLTD